MRSTDTMAARNAAAKLTPPRKNARDALLGYGPSAGALHNGVLQTFFHKV